MGGILFFFGGGVPKAVLETLAIPFPNIYYFFLFLEKCIFKTKKKILGLYNQRFKNFLAYQI